MGFCLLTLRQVCNIVIFRRGSVFMAKVYCIGEALIDFIPVAKGLRLEDVPSFERAPGGAPANLSVAVKKLGGESAFIGKVGDDAFGRLLRETLLRWGVDVSLLSKTSEANTTLAFVALKADGDRDFIFYRNPGADMLLSEKDIPEGVFSRGDILHFCSLGLVDAPVKAAHRRAIELMKRAGGIISFDPNVRLDLWRDHEDCRRAVLEFLPLADLVKVSLDEMPFIFGTEDERAAASRCFDGGAKAFIVTRGAGGSAFYTPEYSKEASPIAVRVEDTTGAGDAYMGAVLSRIAGTGSLSERLSPSFVDETILLAGVVGSITATKKGAIESIPSLDEARRFQMAMGAE